VQNAIVSLQEDSENQTDIGIIFGCGLLSLAVDYYLWLQIIK